MPPPRWIISSHNPPHQHQSQQQAATLTRAAAVAPVPAAPACEPLQPQPSAPCAGPAPPGWGAPAAAAAAVERLPWGDPCCRHHLPKGRELLLPSPHAPRRTLLKAQAHPPWGVGDRPLRACCSSCTEKETTVSVGLSLLTAQIQVVSNRQIRRKAEAMRDAGRPALFVQQNPP